jgi:hypothetical protein
VRTWKYRLKHGKVKRIKKGATGRLLIDHLEVLLSSLIAQSCHLGNPETLRKISPGNSPHTSDAYLSAL